MKCETINCSSAAIENQLSSGYVDTIALHPMLSLAMVILNLPPMRPATQIVVLRNRTLITQRYHSQRHMA